MLTKINHTGKLPEELKKYFWDVAFDDLSLEKHTLFITERILNYGDLDSIKWLLSYTGNDYIKSVIKNSRNLNTKTKNYWQIMLT
jgi:hypothetical protein